MVSNCLMTLKKVEVEVAYHIRHLYRKSITNKTLRTKRRAAESEPAASAIRSLLMRAMFWRSPAARSTTFTLSHQLPNRNLT